MNPTPRGALHNKATCFDPAIPRLQPSCPGGAHLLQPHDAVLHDGDAHIRLLQLCTAGAELGLEGAAILQGVCEGG